MTSITVLDAAELAQAAYKGGQLPPVLMPINEGHVQAYFLKDGTLVVRGSDEAADYTKTNLVASKVKLSWAGMDAAAQAARWHKGFAKHAMVVIRHMGTRRPKLIIGHSLGGAVAQILGCIYNVPAIGFASPRPLVAKSRLAAEKLILNVVRNDDIVARVPPASMGFRWAGNSEVMHAKKTNKGEDHSMKQYMKLLKTEVAEGKVIKKWPVG